MPQQTPGAHIFRSAAIPVAIGLTLLSVACTRVPELEDKLTPALRSAPYPDLTPLGTVRTPLPAPQTQNAELQAELARRRALLQARAKALNAVE